MSRLNKIHLWCVRSAGGVYMCRRTVLEEGQEEPSGHCAGKTSCEGRMRRKRKRWFTTRKGQRGGPGRSFINWAKTLTSTPLTTLPLYLHNSFHPLKIFFSCTLSKSSRQGALRQNNNRRVHLASTYSSSIADNPSSSSSSSTFFLLLLRDCPTSAPLIVHGTRALRVFLNLQSS